MTSGAALGSAVFAGTARDCARYLPMALRRWEALAAVFTEARFLVVENDSRDGTKAILAGWGTAAPRRSVLTMDGLDARHAYRSQRLAAARNLLLDTIAGRPELASADYLVMMDMDDASLAITPGGLRRAMAFDGWDGLFANQLLYYNDVWALRDDERSLDDWTHHVNHLPPGPARSWARLRHLTWRNRPIAPWRKPFRVRSAFGGLGVYRLPLALTARYEGWREEREICEHVPFNETLAARGARLFVHPGLINMLPMPLYRLTHAAGLL